MTPYYWGYPNGPDPYWAGFLRELGENSREHLDIVRQQRKAEKEKTLKIEHKLQKIGYAGMGQVPFELTRLEKQLQSHEVTTWKE